MVESLGEPSGENGAPLSGSPNKRLPSALEITRQETPLPEQEAKPHNGEEAPRTPPSHEEPATVAFEAGVLSTLPAGASICRRWRVTRSWNDWATAAWASSIAPGICA